MKSKWLFIQLMLLAALLISSCQPKAAPASSAAQKIVVQLSGEGPVLLTGSFTYTNDFVVETYYVEQAVAINDLTGFVKRDKLWELPVDGQVLGFMSVDKENNKGSFRLALPVVPEGDFNDVNHDDRKDSGVQIFALTYSPNLTGGPYSEGDDKSFGWPSYLASVKTDAENKDEITGGKLLIWSPDDAQQFPGGFGADGLLFTKDDPVMLVPTGYSVIDLDKDPFAILRDRQSEMTLYEPEDIAVKDYSQLSYQEAFDKMFARIRKEYAFNGISGKYPDWDALYSQLAPQVEAAQKNKDSYAYFLALRQLEMTFKDGHVSLDGGDNQPVYNQKTIFGGFGFAIRELTNRKVMVVYVKSGSPADLAGMKVGAEVTQFNGQPITKAISSVQPLSPQSTGYGLRYEQSVFLTRGSIGAAVTVDYSNPGEPSKRISLTSIYEMDSLFATYMGGERDTNVLPSEYRILPGNIGYIKVNSNYDDLGLLVRIFQRALQTFKDNSVGGLIIDMRHNYGGSPLGLAGFLYDKEIPLGQLQYYSDKSGKFEDEGPRDRVIPNVEQYRFNKMILLVDQFCFSACEIEAYGFSQVPGMQVMGQFPTAGVEGETARGDFKLPDGMSFTVPTGRFLAKNGSIFLEGQGVQPDIKLDVTAESVLSNADTVLNEAIAYIIKK
jgi:C-terminal processing protease CtpA/Prc